MHSDRLSKATLPVAEQVERQPLTALLCVTEVSCFSWQAELQACLQGPRNHLHPSRHSCCLPSTLCLLLCCQSWGHNQVDCSCCSCQQRLRMCPPCRCRPLPWLCSTFDASVNCLCMCAAFTLCPSALSPAACFRHFLGSCKSTHNLQLDCLAIKLNGADLEVHANCANIRLCVSIISCRGRKGGRGACVARQR